MTSFCPNCGTTPSPWLRCASTPARVFVGSAGPAYSTATQLELRRDHAAARDAVRAELHLNDFSADFVARWQLFEVETQASSEREFPNASRPGAATAVRRRPA